MARLLIGGEQMALKRQEGAGVTVVGGSLTHGPPSGVLESKMALTVLVRFSLEGFDIVAVVGNLLFTYRHRDERISKHGADE